MAKHPKALTALGFVELRRGQRTLRERRVIVFVRCKGCGGLVPVADGCVLCSVRQLKQKQRKAD